MIRPILNAEYIYLTIFCSVKYFMRLTLHFRKRKSL